MEYSKGEPRTRPWRAVAQELANEHDPDRVLMLSEELEAAIDEQTSVCDDQSGKKV